MRVYTPPFKIAPTIVQLAEKVAFELGKLTGEKLIAPSVYLRKNNTIKTIHSTLSIEGNPLNQEQVTDVIDGKRVLGAATSILEVKNALAIYSMLKTFDPLDLQALLNAHAVFMDGLVDAPGHFRTSHVRVGHHIPPQATRVPALMEDLFKYLNDNDNYSFLIKACVFHYEFEFIHPFEDGNGRMGRLWQQLLLMKHHLIFEYISLETLIKHHQEEYYQALSRCDQAGESTTFIEFMLKMILQTLQEYGQSRPKLPNTPEERLEYAKEILKTDIFARQDYMKLHNNISSATASRDLEFAVKKQILQSKGKMNKMLYSFTSDEKTAQIYTHLLYEDIEDSYLHNGVYRPVSTLSTDALQNIIQSELDSIDVTQLIEQCAFLNMWVQTLPFQESRITSMNILRNLKFPVDTWNSTKVLLHRDMLLYLIGAATAGTHNGKIKCAGARTYIGQRKMTELFFLTNSLLSRLITQGQLPSHTKIDRLLLQLIRDTPQSDTLEITRNYYLRWLIRYHHIYCCLMAKSDASNEKLEEGIKLLEKHLGVSLKEYFSVVYMIFTWFIESNYFRNCGETVDEGFKSSDMNTFFIMKDNFPSNGVFIQLIEKLSIDLVGMQKHLLEAASEDQKKARVFDPFFARSLKYFQHPIAKVGEGKFCILDFKFMIEGLCSGLSWRLQPLLEEAIPNDTERNKVLGELRSGYGSLVEPYFLEVLRKVFGEITESLQGQQKKPDAIVKGKGITLLFEFTVEYYSIEALYSINTEKLFKCLDRLFFNTSKNPGKMKNLDNYIQNEQKENSETTFLPILITERYLGDPTLLKKAGYDLEHKINEKQWDGLKTCPLIISLDELEQFWMFADNDRDEAIKQFADLATKWLGAQQKSIYGYSFGKFLMKQIRTDTLNRAYTEFFNNAALSADVGKKICLMDTSYYSHKFLKGERDCSETDYINIIHDKTLEELINKNYRSENLKQVQQRLNEEKVGTFGFTNDQQLYSNPCRVEFLKSISFNLNYHNYQAQEQHIKDHCERTKLKQENDWKMILEAKGTWSNKITYNQFINEFFPAFITIVKDLYRQDLNWQDPEQLKNDYPFLYTELIFRCFGWFFENIKPRKKGVDNQALDRCKSFQVILDNEEVTIDSNFVSDLQIGILIPFVDIFLTCDKGQALTLKFLLPDQSEKIKYVTQ